jgi:hypothetical protein
MRPAGVVVSIASVRLRNPAFGLGQPLHNNQHIPQRAREPVESTPPAHPPCGADPKAAGVRAGPSGRQMLARDRYARISPLSARPLAPRCPGPGLIGRDASVADQHCVKVSPMISIKQQRFATRQPAQIALRAFRYINVRFCKHPTLNSPPSPALVGSFASSSSEVMR